MSDSVEMTASELAGYLRRIRLTYCVSELHALVGDIERRFGDDEDTPRLQSVIAAKVERLALKDQSGCPVLGATKRRARDWA